MSMKRILVCFMSVLVLGGCVEGKSAAVKKFEQRIKERGFVRGYYHYEREGGTVFRSYNIKINWKGNKHEIAGEEMDVRDVNVMIDENSIDNRYTLTGILWDHYKVDNEQQTVSLLNTNNELVLKLQLISTNQFRILEYGFQQETNFNYSAITNQRERELRSDEYDAKMIFFWGFDDSEKVYSW